MNISTINENVNMIDNRTTTHATCASIDHFTFNTLVKRAYVHMDREC